MEHEVNNYSLDDPVKLRDILMKLSDELDNNRELIKNCIMQFLDVCQAIIEAKGSNVDWKQYHEKKKKERKKESENQAQNQVQDVHQLLNNTTVIPRFSDSAFAAGNLSLNRGQNLRSATKNAAHSWRKIAPFLLIAAF